MSILEKYESVGIYEFQFANENQYDILIKQLLFFNLRVIELNPFSEDKFITIYLSLNNYNFGSTNYHTKRKTIENIYELANIIIEVHKKLHPEE